jgi:FMN phosphatase YigB (HAD superfamily)
VSSILSSLGVLVRNQPPGARQESLEGKGSGTEGIIDFITLSYDVGVEKPHQKIFEAAFEEAKRLDGGKEREWAKVHVGDDLEKDVKAAERAGWRGILWNGEGEPKEILRDILGSKAV